MWSGGVVTMTMTNKYEVCPECDGEGYTSRLGDFTANDVDEWFGDASA